MWSADKCNGWGILYYLHQNRRDQAINNRYQGMFENGHRNGIGAFFYADGSKYEGEWSSNQKEGFAVFTYEDGKRLEAIFEKDRLTKTLSIANDTSDNMLFNPVTMPLALEEIIDGTATVLDQTFQGNISQSRQFENSTVAITFQQVGVQQSVLADKSNVKSASIDEPKLLASAFNLGDSPHFKLGSTMSNNQPAPAQNLTLGNQLTPFN